MEKEIALSDEVLRREMTTPATAGAQHAQAKGEVKTPAERERAADSPLGTHPVGTAVGGVTGAVATGAAVGSVAGPVGTAVGAAVGAAAGGMTGKLVADVIDPQMEDQFWRDNWLERDYAGASNNYDDDWGPAYRYGVESFKREPEGKFDDQRMATGWEEARGSSRLGWGDARFATMDAWQRARDLAERAAPGDADRDGK